MELWDIYTKDRVKTGRTHVRGTPLKEGDYHLVVEIITIINYEKILLTQRHPNKTGGLLWEWTGGSALTGDNSNQAAIRELEEEVGLSVEESDIHCIYSYYKTDSFYDVYVYYKENFNPLEITMQPEEVVDFKLVSWDEFNSMFEQGLVLQQLDYVQELYQQGKIKIKKS